MRASNNAIVLFLALTTGCFGSRDVSGRDSDGGDSSKRDSGASDRGSTGGSVERFDAGISQDSRSVSPFCGNNVVEGDEKCDRVNLAGASCETLGYGGGTLHCTSDCRNFDTSMCEHWGFCGDAIKEYGEICDGPDLAGASCEDLGFASGTLYCVADCQNYDTSMCYSDGYYCGNNIRELGEVCDGTDLAGQSCWSLRSGFTGTLGCARGCNNFDMSMCYEEVDDGGVDDEI